MVRKITFLVLFLSYVTALQAQSEFIEAWGTTTNRESIIIPTMKNAYHYVIVWGGYNTTLGISQDAPHSHSTAGAYHLGMTRDFSRIYFNNTRDKLKMRSAKPSSFRVWISMEHTFWSGKNLEEHALEAPNLSNTIREISQRPILQEICFMKL